MNILNTPDERGHFGAFGGRYIAETLMPAILELTEAYTKAQENREFPGRPEKALYQLHWQAHAFVLRTGR